MEDQQLLAAISVEHMEHVDEVIMPMKEDNMSGDLKIAVETEEIAEEMTDKGRINP